MKQQVKYFLTCLRKHLSQDCFACPSCGHPDSTIESRKYLVTALRRCQECQLLFRAPTTTSAENVTFYQDDYRQGFTTVCPSDHALRTYMANGFSNSGKNYSTYIDVVRAAGGKTGARLFDFGCSWGYGSWQFMQAGYDVESFEISAPRARYARDKLGVKVHSSFADVTGQFDIFFSAHVLEHVPSVKNVIDFGMSILKPGGLFIAFTPNGSSELRARDGVTWNHLWGLVHPNFLDDRYYKVAFAGNDFLIASDPHPIHEIERWKDGRVTSNTLLPLHGIELLLVAMK